MYGIRVSNIQPTLSVELLLSYFESSSEGKIDKIYYPLLNNEAVITIQDKHAVANILIRQEISIGTVKVGVKPLPHQIFSQISVLLEEEVACLVSATAEYKDVLLQNGVKIFSTKSSGLGLKGNWYEVEWAWNYLHGILDRQFHIQDNLRQHLYETLNPVTHMVNEGETTKKNPVLANSVTASKNSVRNQSSIPERIADRIASSPTSSINSTLDSIISRSPSSLLGAVGGHSESSLSKITYNTRETCLDSERSSDTIRHSRTTESLNINHSDHLTQNMRSSGTNSITSLHSSTDAKYRSFGDPVMNFSDQEARDRKDPIRFSRTEDADDTFENFASLKPHNNKKLEEQIQKNPTIGNVLANSDDVSDRLTRQLAELHVGQTHTRHSSGSSTDTEAKESKVDKLHLTESITHIKAKETPLLNDVQNSQHSTRYSNNTGDKETSASSSQMRNLQRSMSLKEFQFKLANGIEISVYYGSIIKTKVDCIVNAANSELQNWSGVAEAIKRAAGPELKDDCEEYIRHNTELALTHAMHTRAGGQLKHLKCIIHTVGPIYFKGKHELCLQLLTRTFYNCLKYADEKVFVKSLAFPFISTGMFEVPLECCVEAFLDAVVLFANESKSYFFLRNIHFVNNDADSVCTAIIMLQQRLEKPFLDLVKEAQAKKKDVLYSEPSSARKSRQSERSSSSNRRSSSLSRLPATKNTDNRKSADITERMKWDALSHDQSKNDYTKDTFSLSHHHHSGSLNTDPRKSKTNKTTISQSRPASSSHVSEKHYFTAAPDPTKTMPNMSTLRSNFPGDSRVRKFSSTTNSSNIQTSTQHVRATFISMSHYTDEKTGSTTPHRTERKTYLHSDENFTNLPTKLPSHNDDNNCSICLEEMVRPKRLECGHEFCRHCIDSAFRNKPVCPQCGKLYGSLKGDQPKSGQMISVVRKNITIPGYESSNGAIEITYDFPPGIQEADHPNPGKKYSGIYRHAYLPNNTEGQEVLSLLKKAFSAGLIFTIGQSRTTGQEDVLIWNGIPHKTKVYSTEFGYPDPGYLRTVKEELAFKGITK